MTFFSFANSADPDEVLYFVALHLGLQCLPKYSFMDFQYTKVLNLRFSWVYYSIQNTMLALQYLNAVKSYLKIYMYNVYIYYFWQKKNLSLPTKDENKLKVGPNMTEIRPSQIWMSITLNEHSSTNIRVLWFRSNSPSTIGWYDAISITKIYAPWGFHTSFRYNFWSCVPLSVK